MNKELREMRNRLKELAEREAYKMWRLARKAMQHGVSAETVETIRGEARTLHEEMTAYQDRLIYWKTEYRFKYAFK